MWRAVPRPFPQPSGRRRGQPSVGVGRRPLPDRECVRGGLILPVVDERPRVAKHESRPSPICLSGHFVAVEKSRKRCPLWFSTRPINARRRGPAPPLSAAMTQLASSTSTTVSISRVPTRRRRTFPAFARLGAPHFQRRGALPERHDSQRGARPRRHRARRHEFARASRLLSACGSNRRSLGGVNAFGARSSRGSVIRRHRTARHGAVAASGRPWAVIQSR
jgi:hypothetical protein